MKRIKEILFAVVSLALVAAISVGATVAYLTSEDSDVNVMTMGNVKIRQIEQERDENGKLVDFTQAKPALPAVYEGSSIEYADPENWIVANDPAWKILQDNENVIDKFVSVQNTGKSDAYVRTVIAFEVGADAVNDPYMHLCYNGEDWSCEWVKDETTGEEVVVSIDGNFYKLCVFVHAQSLSANETSNPSLKQIYLDKAATNAVCEAYGDTFEILVVSQAVQAAGFADAETALNTAFGAITGDNHPWADGDLVLPVVVNSVDDMRTAMKTPGAKIILGEDIVIDDDKGTGYCLYAKYDCEIDLNGHNIVADLPGKDFYGVIYALNGAKVNVVGEGNITVSGGIGPFVWCTGANGATQINIYGGNWTEASDDFGADYCEGLYANREGAVNIYGGTFNWSSFPKYTANESRDGVVTVYGGTFINFDPRVSHDSDGSYVADGYTVVSETQDNGDIWYTVVPEK